MDDTQENAISNYGYIYTALKPSIVSHSTAGSFLGVGETNLLVAKNAYLEVFSIEENQLHLQNEIATYLRIRKLMTIKTMFPVDLLFIVLDMYFVIASFDFETKELRPLYSKKTLSRDETDRSDLLFALYNSPEPSKRFDIGFSVDGVMSLLQFEADLVFNDGHGLTGTVSEKSLDFTIEAGCDIIDMVFMDGGTSAAFITRDTSSKAIAVKTYEIDVEHSTLLPGNISGTTNDTTTCSLVPVPIQGGVITIGSKEINYFKPTGKKMISFSSPDMPDDDYQHCLIKQCTILDTNLFLYGDASARWFLIQLERDKGGEVSKMNRIELGLHGHLNSCTKVAKIQQDSSLVAYVVFAGIAKTDSLLATIIPTNPSDQRVEIEAKYNSFYATNVVLNESDPHCTTIVGCSDKNNYLNVLKSGASITEYASFEQNNVKAVWGVKKHLDDEYHSFLVFSFVGHTRILRAQKDVTEATIDSIDPNVETLYIGNADHDNILHVTSRGAALMNSDFKIISEWKAPNSGIITAAEATSSQLTIAQGKKLYQFRIEKQALSLQANSTQQDDIASIIYDKDEDGIGKAIFVALWQSNTVHCLAVLSLQPISTIQVNERDGALIRSLALKSSDLMVGLGDGRVLHYHYDTNTHVMKRQKAFQIGTTQARCVSVDIEGNDYFFVCTDRPSIIISDEFGLRAVPVNSTSPVWFICPFKFEYLNDWAIVACSSTEVKIISMDNVQKLHATKFDMKDYVPCDIDRLESDDLYAVLSSKNGGSHIHLVNIDLPSDHPQNQYTFTIDNEAEPLCICQLKMKSPAGQVSDFLGAIVYSGQSSTMGLYKVQKNDRGISVISEVQSIQFENRVLRMKSCNHMAILCCVESLIVVNLNANGDLDFVAEFEGLFYHNITLDEKSGLVVPLSLSTEIDFFRVTELNNHVEIKQLDMDQGIGYKCIDLPLKVAFLNGEHKQVVAGTMQGRLQFFFGPANKRSHKFNYNLSDSVSSMNTTKNNTVIYTTQSGAVGVCKLISKEDHKVLLAIQMQLSEHLQTLLPISHDEIRFNYSAIEDEDYTPMSHLRTNLIDGDFVVKFLTLRKELKDEIEKELNMNVTEFIQRFHEGLLFT